MPLYEYKCGKCSYNFEELRSIMRRDEKTDCPVCGSNTERRPSVFATAIKDSSGHTSFSGGGCASCHGGNCSTCGH